MILRGEVIRPTRVCRTARLDAAHGAAGVSGSPKARSALARRLRMLVLGDCSYTGVGLSDGSAWVQDAGEQQGDERLCVQPPFSYWRGYRAPRR